MLSNLLVFILLLSPLWPIGENPIVGDPFLIVNKKINELAYINEGQIQKIYKIATGKEDDLTPVGKFTVTVKAVNPYYRKKDIPGGAKENPLGTRWIGFDAENTDGRTYGVHGNNNPDSIGRYITQGCIRLYNEEVEELFTHIPIGTQIVIVSSDLTFKKLGQEYGAIPREHPHDLKYFLQ
ncbi:L,D-transpeptidase [Schinkia azotoformans]|uniref:L,D-transpeptidase n=1 Tax=Schinkia azotoformans TaxID=1454 RepID=UPI002DBBAD90|nr:L,D-transpeptidase [Schinkia azotoformans]MEC1723072.1 L,D-transpeptidase [Schinkia azotoformans]MED4414734.1 L,D-transpeptidase [Schinkia azotoformans]